jgi:hypothetical protein
MRIVDPDRWSVRSRSACSVRAKLAFGRESFESSPLIQLTSSRRRIQKLRPPHYGEIGNVALRSSM